MPSMVNVATVTSLVQLLLACLVSSQSCPPNTAMGLCQSVPNPCFGDNDCINGELCCPEACSRTCKPRYSRPVSRDVSAPDLLNDPRVYIGKCPDATCYNMFGGEPDECSTSHLCPRGKLCCNDGCRNVCRVTPEYAAMIAREEARVKSQQQMLIQRQQEEMRRRQMEMYEQRQRQIATAELARRQAEARAAAEAELSAQQARAKYEANLRAVAAAQSRAVSAMNQRMAQRQQQQQQYSIQQQPAASVASGFVDKFVGEPQVRNTINRGTDLEQPTAQTKAQQEQTTPSLLHKLNDYYRAMKKDRSAGSLINQIHSPANANPYNPESQQTVQAKANPSLATLRQEVATADQAPHHLSQSSQQLPPTYQDQLLIPNYPALPARSYQRVQNYQLRQPQTSYQSVRQVGNYNAYNEPGQDAVNPMLMYHAMQTAA